MGPQEQFFQHLKDGRFMLQRQASGEHVFYPRWLPGDWEWVEVSGEAEVYSRTVIRRKPERGGDYCIAVVTLTEGPRMMTRVVGIEASEVTIGLKLKAAIVEPDWQTDPGPVVVFMPTEKGNA